jgi:propanol-preferring alcohol dehydrogenase
LPVEKLVTHEFTIQEAEKAFRMFDNHETEKAVFVFN